MRLARVTRNKSILPLLMHLETSGRVANSVDPDQPPRSAVSDLGLHCLFRPFCPNT